MISQRFVYTLLIIAVLEVNFTYAGTAHFPSGDPPKDLANQTGCYSDLTETVLPYDKEVTPTVACVKLKCLQNSFIEITTCEVPLVDHGCRIQKNKGTFPACCDSVTCNKTVPQKTPKRKKSNKIKTPVIHNKTKQTPQVSTSKTGENKIKAHGKKGNKDKKSMSFYSVRQHDDNDENYSDDDNIDYENYYNDDDYDESTFDSPYSTEDDLHENEYNSYKYPYKYYPRQHPYYRNRIYYNPYGHTDFYYNPAYGNRRYRDRSNKYKYPRYPYIIDNGAHRTDYNEFDEYSHRDIYNPYYYGKPRRTGIYNQMKKFYRNKQNIRHFPRRFTDHAGYGPRYLKGRPRRNFHNKFYNRRYPNYGNRRFGGLYYARPKSNGGAKSIISKKNNLNNKSNVQIEEIAKTRVSANHEDETTKTSALRKNIGKVKVDVNHTNDNKKKLRKSNSAKVVFVKIPTAAATKKHNVPKTTKGKDKIHEVIHSKVYLNLMATLLKLNDATKSKADSGKVTVFKAKNKKRKAASAFAVT